MRVFAPLAVSAALLGAGGCGGDDDSGLGEVEVERVKQQVAETRGLDFKRDQPVEVASEDEIVEEIEELVKEAVREQPEKVEAVERGAAAFEGLLALSGLIQKADKFKPVGGANDIGLGGVYIGEMKKLYVVEEAADESRDLAEVVLAHELAHALEDQHFAGFEPELEPVSDRGLALQALHEGSAQLLEARYSAKYVKERLTARQLVDRELQRVRKARIPPGLRALASFPYLDGAVFARGLARGKRPWRLVNRAHRRPPTTTEQIFHPDKWVAGEVGRPPALPVEDAIPAGFRKLGGGDLGELHTRTILASGVPLPEARRAAAGWGGGRYELYYSGGLPRLPCEETCRRATIGVLAWVWDTPADAAEFRQAAGRYVTDLVGRIDHGAAALGGFGLTSTLVFAPTQALAVQIANQEVPAG